MSNRFYVGTRKGLFVVSRSGSGWQISDPHFLGDPVNIVLPDNRDGTLYAALPLGHFGVKLRCSRDDGSTWEECQVPQYPKADDQADGPSDAVSLDEIWCLESAGPDKPGELWCGTIPGGLFHSSDSGQSWTLVQSLWNAPERAHWFGGGKDQPGIHSICVDPRDSNTVTVGVSCGGVWQTQDYGQTWQVRAEGMFAAYMPPDRAGDPTIQDPHMVVQCQSHPDTFWAQHHNGIFVSTDNCRSWSSVENARPSGFGFAVAVHPKDGRTAWFVPATKDECRVPVDGKFVASRTCDGGQSFEVLSDGLPPAPAWHIVYRHALAVDESGTHLAMGSTTGGLRISEDAGDHWTLLSNDLPPVYCVRFA
jgi:hypothetical protein